MVRLGVYQQIRNQSILKGAKHIASPCRREEGSEDVAQFRYYLISLCEIHFFIVAYTQIFIFYNTIRTIIFALPKKNTLSSIHFWGSFCAHLKISAFYVWHNLHDNLLNSVLFYFEPRFSFWLSTVLLCLSRLLGCRREDKKQLLGLTFRVRIFLKFGSEILGNNNALI